MTRYELRQQWKHIRQEMGDMICNVDNALCKIEEQINANGCKDCAFMDKEEWEMPCCKCKRNCKDYWRAKKQE